jgi:ribulose-phosphate 3-epimerase
MPYVCASLHAAEYARMGEDVRREEQAGVDSFHFDRMDGQYARNLALTPRQLKAPRPYTNPPFPVHLELTNPDEIIDACQPLGADTLIFQSDTLSDPRRSFNRARALGE